MITVLEVAFTCYAVTDMDRARGFYEGVLGLKPAMVVNGDHGKWVEYEIGPHTICLGSSGDFKPSADGCCAALEVANFDEAIKELRGTEGIKFRVEPFESPVCNMAMIFDPDGNTICIHRRKAA